MAIAYFWDRIALLGLVDEICAGHLGGPAVACFRHVYQGWVGIGLHVDGLACRRGDSQSAWGCDADDCMCFCIGFVHHSSQNGFDHRTLYRSGDRDCYASRLVAQKQGVLKLCDGIYV